MTFVEPIALASLNSTTFYVVQDGDIINGLYSVEGNAAVYTPGIDFQKEKPITVTLSGDITDTSGNRLSQGYSWSFEPTKHPTVASTSPADDALNVAVNSPITAVFSEAMDPGSININTFTLTDGISTISGSISYSELTATFEPDSSLSEWTEYTVTVTTGVLDLAGNAMLSDYSWSFKTDDTANPQVISVDPSNHAEGVILLPEISITFSEEMDTSSITTNITNTACGGSLQLSLNNFNTCIQMWQEPLASNNNNKTFTVRPDFDLSEAEFKVKVTTLVKDRSGKNMLFDYSWIFATLYLTTSDSTTGLMWQDNMYTDGHDWYSAISYCNNLSLIGYDDWRLPSIGEIGGLYSRRSILRNYVESKYWSSTEYESSLYPYNTYAYYKDFGTGTTFRILASQNLSVRCVRGGSE
jgi:hypothetical protein